MDQTVTLDPKVEIGAVQTVVEVSTQGVPLDTETSTLSYVVEHQQMTELPLILRDPYQLVLLGPRRHTIGWPGRSFGERWP